MAGQGGRPKSGALGTFVVAGGVLALSWLAIRTMSKRASDAPVVDAGASPTATTGRDDGLPLLTPIPSAIVEDAGKPGLVRVDLVLRVDGVAVTVDGARQCYDGPRSLIGREPNGGSSGSFDEGALRTCLLGVIKSAGVRKLVATIGRAGTGVPTTYADALVAAVKRIGIVEVVLAP